jgi:hypothetical protein
MRSAGNFSPEWGYLAPAPSFARTARVVLVATAIGATAGAGVVLSLIDRPSEPEKTPVAARAIVTSVRTAAVPSVSPAAPAAPVAAASSAAPAKPAPRPASIAAAAPGDKPDNSLRTVMRPTSQSPAAPVAPTNAAAVAPAAGMTANTSANISANASSVAAGATQATSTDSGAGSGAASAAATASAGDATALPAAAEPPKVVEAAPADEPDGTGIVAPEEAPPKKAKRHASTKAGPLPGIGTIFRRMFAAHGGGRSYYPNSQ